ncbi:hypothetical protein [Lactobacillus sp. CBA3605] [Lactiplantibacillus mudanjiangensis]|uniref:sensor histidine kinase n=1 Tax=Lactiplantibacillus mudanjiangensis TaxID=1296538 RepID=UPI001013E02B|nr:hypothetical protein [Lactobacillus sp. CBA3605] [Lactiplantibacillus mudanjiangensis]
MVDTRAYIFEMFMDIVFIYGFYNLIETYPLSWIARTIGFLLTPIILLLNAKMGFCVYLIYGFSLYLVTYKFHFNAVGVNLLLFTILSLIIATLLTNVIMTPFFDIHAKQGWFFVLCNLAVEVSLMAIILFGFKTKVIGLFKQKDFSHVLMFLQSSLLVILYFFIQLIDELGIYDRFTLGTLAFTIAEFLLLSSLFWLIYARTKRRYRAQIEQQQLDNLKSYTEQLEQSQMTLRKFRHDYKNMLLSVSELAQSGDLSAVNRYLADLQDYSNQELSEQTDQYQDIGNVQEIHMKSILLSKFFTMAQQKIDYHFECQVPVKTLTINPFDMVRLLSITLDNAIEAVQTASTKTIAIMIFQADDSLSLTIANTYAVTTRDFDELRQPGVTTKKQHSGLGLSIIDDLRRKYPQLLVSQQDVQGVFTVQLVLTNQH